MATSLLKALRRADVILVNGMTVFNMSVGMDDALSAYDSAGQLLGKFNDQMVTLNTFGNATAVSEVRGAVLLTFYVSRSMKEEDVR